MACPLITYMLMDGSDQPKNSNASLPEAMTATPAPKASSHQAACCFCCCAARAKAMQSASGIATALSPRLMKSERSDIREQVRGWVRVGSWQRRVSGVDCWGQPELGSDQDDVI